jgi:hypothetical protein
MPCIIGLFDYQPLFSYGHVHPSPQSHKQSQGYHFNC